MENIEFERNYENESVSEEDKFFFEQMVAPGGVFESFQKEMDAIPKMIVPEDKTNYEYLLEKCDAFAPKYFGRTHGMVDYTHWDAYIDVIVPMLEFCDPEDMALLKDIGEKAHCPYGTYFREKYQTAYISKEDSNERNNRSTFGGSE